MIQDINQDTVRGLSRSKWGARHMTAIALLLGLVIPILLLVLSKPPADAESKVSPELEPSTAQAFAEQFFAAIQNGDVEAAWRMTSNRLQRVVDKRAFAATVKAFKGNGHSPFGNMSLPADESASPNARAFEHPAHGHGSFLRARVLQEGGHWRVDSIKLDTRGPIPPARDELGPLH